MISVKTQMLKQKIYAKGYSLSEFSKLCGKTKSSIGNVLKRGSISANFAKVVCDTLCVKFEDIFLAS